MEFRILGPLEVRGQDNRLLSFGRSKHRSLLALLLLQHGRLVPTDRLIEGLWGTQPPRSARSNLKTYVWALRGALAHNGDGGSPIQTCGIEGYRVQLRQTDLDELVFEDLASAGQQCVARGDVARGARLLGDALALWRGRALEDVPISGESAAQLVRLQERRLATYESYFDARLALGEHSDVIGALGVMLATHPLQERFWAQLILALYRAGRQADALTAYGTIRRRLVEELAIEPSHGLQQLQRRILRADRSLDIAPTPVTVRGPAPAMSVVTPRQLPPANADFTGRATELHQLHQHLAPAAAQAGVPSIAVISGMAGVGKSTLAVRAAHELARFFPNGQLYADLGGATAPLATADSAAILNRLYRSLGADHPAGLGLDEAATLFRSLLSQQRVLIVLDNATDAAQVRPLLPASPTCAVIVTSRRMLGVLGGAAHVHLDTFSEDEALQLLTRLTGKGRIEAERGAAVSLAKLCGHHALALRIAGTRLAARPHWPLKTLVDRLLDPGQRLDELRAGDLSLRAAFHLSLDMLAGSKADIDRDAAHAFRLLGALPSRGISLVAVASLLNAPLARVESILERLVDADLVQSPAPGQYRLHDLIRLFALSLSPIFEATGTECASEPLAPNPRPLDKRGQAA